MTENRNTRQATDAMVRQYIETALWSTIMCDCDEPYDSKYSYDDMHPSAIEKARRDLNHFLLLAGNKTSDVSDKDIAHNLWLTREHHGSGFWDRDYNHKDELTKLAHDMGEISLYTDDNGQLHFE